ncbi:MAG: AmmeMemoRadiSam system protein B [Candidatus Abawacabacteria bacterium]|nr:AmmeMemoRadiSam system protein B [Candidatus Abawacabacteria bacterium]
MLPSSIAIIASLISSLFAPTISFAPENNVVAAIVPHHLPTAQAIVTDIFAELGKETPGTIVLVSPDHWGIASSNFTTVADDHFQGIAIDTTLRSQLIAQMPEYTVSMNDTQISKEHGITALLSTIKHYSPESKLLPLVISIPTTEESLDNLARILTKFDHIAAVASTDFSHYLPSQAADLHDLTSLSTIFSFTKENFSRLEVDCWQCLYLVHAIADQKDAHDLELRHHTNSAKITNSEHLAPEVTSYVGMLMRKGQKPTTFDLPITMIAVGDIMLDRYVESLILKHGKDYPLKNIRQLLHGFDIVMGNLEGPVIAKRKQTPHNSLNFSFAPQLLSVLEQYGFTIFTIANNHTHDHGKEGFQETQEHIHDAGLESVGSPVEVNEHFVVSKEIKGKTITFLGFNATSPLFSEESALQLIDTVNANKNSLLLVNIHWGEEYQLKHNTRQQSLAHKFIDHGVDGIIGHHPHVVQPIEIYQGKAIFYSLGNFIFDQYFSTNTQEELAVGLTIYQDSIQYSLFPLISKKSQPELMTPEKAKQFLSNLAKRSTPELGKAIESAMIETKL